MTQPVEAATRVTLSGRELALQRRQALARHGRGGSAVRSAAAAPRVPAPPAVAAEGKAGCGCGCGGRDPGCATPAVPPPVAQAEAGTAAIAGRALAPSNHSRAARATRRAPARLPHRSTTTNRRIES